MQFCKIILQQSAPVSTRYHFFACLQELEKFKFVLEYQCSELRSMLDPKDREVAEKKQEVQVCGACRQFSLVAAQACHSPNPWKASTNVFWSECFLPMSKIHMHCKMALGRTQLALLYCVKWQVVW